MKKALIAISAALISVSAFTSCDKRQQDNVRPVVNLIAPEEGGELQIGDKHGVHFDMELKDNEMLKSYKLEVHSNFDNHVHSAAMRHDDGKATEPFFFQRTYNLDQKEAKIHHHEIVIPENATPGAYHLMVYVTDAVGNETVVARNVKLVKGNDGHQDPDDEAPIVTLVSPEEGEELGIGDAHGVHFDLKAKGHKPLKSYKLEVRSKSDDHTHSAGLLHGDESGTPFEFSKTYDLGSKEEVAIHHHDIVIPKNAAPGAYQLTVSVSDVANKTTVVTHNVKLVQGSGGGHHH